MGSPAQFDFSSIAEKPEAAPMKPHQFDFSSIAEPQSNTGQADAPTATMGAAPKAGFLGDLENDLRQGGNRTIVGRTLGRMQGRGDQGYTGLESGTTKAAADIMGSIPLGAVKTAQGIAETPEHPVMGPLKAVGGVLQMATIPGMFAGGPAAEAALEAAPSAKWAAKMFESVAGDAGNVPVSLSRSSDAILRAHELGEAGAGMPKAVNKIIKRATDPDAGPLTYSQARDYYSQITALSAKDRMAMNPIMKRQVGIIAGALKDDIGDAANQVGRAADYYASLKNYARAKALMRTATQMGKWAAAAAGAAGAVEVGKMIVDRSR